MSDWKAPAGTVKRECNQCRRDFASRGGALTCPICLTGRGRKKPASASASPFDPFLGGVGYAPAAKGKGLSK